MSSVPFLLHMVEYSCSYGLRPVTGIERRQ